MRILQIAPPWINIPPQDYGGTEQVLYNLIEGLHTLGHEVTVYATKKSRVNASLTYTFDKSLIDQGLPWEAALPALIHYYEAFKLAPKFDVVHAHLSSQTDIMVLPFLADLADRHIPAVMTIHGHRPYDRFSHTDDVFLRKYGSKVEVINISQAMVSFTPKQFKQAGVVYNSINPRSVTFKAKAGNYVTWLGKIIPDKNPVEAIQAAKAAGIPIKFGGVVDPHNPQSVSYFETQVKPLIDGKDVVYVGPVNRKTKSQLLSNALAFLYPILWDEPFGMVMVEAMAAGTPVIAYNRGAAPELIAHGQTGFIVSDRKSMLQAITRIHSIDRKACRYHIETKFSPLDAAVNHVDMYQKLIDKYAIVGTPEYLPQKNPVGHIMETLDYAFGATLYPPKRLRLK